MAKIVIFSDAILETDSRAHFTQKFTRQVVNHAAETANEIYFVTQNGFEPKGFHSKVQILQAFKTWSLFETTKLLPILFQIRAEIFHFVQPIKKIGLGHAFPVLAAFAKTTNAKTMLSLIDFERGIGRGLEAMIHASEMVSVIDPIQSHVLGRKFTRLEIECLPAQSHKLQISDEITADMPENFIFLPENLVEYDDPLRSIEILKTALRDGHQLLIAGSLLDFDLTRRRKYLQTFGELASHVRWTGPISPLQKLQYMKQARAVLLAGLRFSPSLIHENLGLILSARAPAIFTMKQVSTSQLPIENFVHAAVVELSQTENALAQLLSSEALRESMRNNLAELGRHHSTDDLGNRLSRMYAKLLS